MISLFNSAIEIRKRLTSIDFANKTYHQISYRIVFSAILCFQNWQTYPPWSDFVYSKKLNLLKKLVGYADNICVAMH